MTIGRRWTARAAAVRHRRPEAQAILIGCYSRRHHGVFTLMGTNTHVHAVVGRPLEAGHVEVVVVPAGARCRFPSSTP